MNDREQEVHAKNDRLMDEAFGTPATLIKPIAEWTKEEYEAEYRRFCDEDSGWFVALDMLEESHKRVRERVVRGETPHPALLIGALNFMEKAKFLAAVTIRMASDSCARMKGYIASARCAYCEWSYRDEVIDSADVDVTDADIVSFNERVSAQLRQHVMADCPNHPMREMEAELRYWHTLSDQPTDRSLIARVDAIFDSLGHDLPDQPSLVAVVRGQAHVIVADAWQRRTPSSRVVPRNARGIYVASRTRHAPMWLHWRVDGCPIVSTWLNEWWQGGTVSFRDLWTRVVREISGATALVAYREGNEPLKGALVEIGVALGQGVPVYFVGSIEGYSFQAHPLFTQCGSVDEAMALAISHEVPGNIPGSSRAESGDIDGASAAMTRAGLEPATYGLKGPDPIAGQKATEGDESSSEDPPSGDTSRSAPEIPPASPEKSPDDLQELIDAAGEVLFADLFTDAPECQHACAELRNRIGTAISRLTGIPYTPEDVPPREGDDDEEEEPS